MAEHEDDRSLPGTAGREALEGTAAPNPVLVVSGDGSRPRDTRSPAEIEAELELTRAHLSATLDELSERLRPRAMARQAGQGVRARFTDRATGRVRRARVALAGAAGVAVLAGAAGLAARRRRR